jgi:hypothetical protein
MEQGYRKIEVVIPSAGRWYGPCTTDKWVSNAIICVPESELGKYKEVNPTSEIISHPDSIIGLGKKRDWIWDKFGDVFQMDDDLKGISRNTMAVGERSQKLSPNEAYEVIQMLGNFADAMGIYLFGLGNCTSPQMYCPNKPFGLSGWIAGACLGMLKNNTLRTSDKIQIKHDYYICALNAFYYRMALIDFRYVINTDSVGKTQGGLQKFRNPEVEYEDSIMLRSIFGNAIRAKQKGFNRLKNKYGRVLHVPF